MANVKELQQLSSSTTNALAQLARKADPEGMWSKALPLLRTVCWLLPEHVPDTPAASSGGTATDRQGPGVTTGAAYVQAVATVSSFGCFSCLLLRSFLLCHVASSQFIGSVCSRSCRAVSRRQMSCTDMPHIAHPAGAHSSQGSLAAAVLEIASQRVKQHLRVCTDTPEDESAIHQVLEENLFLMAVIHKWA
jgi:hypothetical protein